MIFTAALVIVAWAVLLGFMWHHVSIAEETTE